MAGKGRSKIFPKVIAGVVAMVLLHLILISLPAKVPTYVFVFPVTLSLLMVLLLVPEMEDRWKYRFANVPPWKYFLRTSLPITRVDVQESENSYLLTVNFGVNVHGIKIHPGLLYAEPEGLHFYPFGADYECNGRRIEVVLPYAPALVFREFTFLPAVRMYWEGSFYYLSPIGPVYRVYLKDKRLRIQKNVVMAIQEDDGFTFKLLEGDCDRCTLFLAFTVKVPGREVHVERPIGTVRGGGRSKSVRWRPSEGGYVLLFREEDLWEIDEEIAGIPTEGFVLRNSEGEFSVESKVVVEISHFGQWTRKRETPVYRVPFQV